MRRITAIGLLLVCALLVTAAAQAGRFRPEQERLRPVDVALAKRTFTEAHAPITHQGVVARAVAARAR
jgi:hypothetical protein